LCALPEAQPRPTLFYGAVKSTLEKMDSTIRAKKKIAHECSQRKKVFAMYQNSRVIGELIWRTFCSRTTDKEARSDPKHQHQHRRNLSNVVLSAPLSLSLSSAATTLLWYVLFSSLSIQWKEGFIDVVNS
jgi:hypothetical protein